LHQGLKEHVVDGHHTGLAAHLNLAVHHLDVFARSNLFGFVRELLVVYPIPI
jgi:hypothetical protein